MARRRKDARDGTTWNPVANSTNIFSIAGYGVAWNGKIWVASGEGTNNLAYSSNGINWYGLGTTTFSGGYGYSVSGNPGIGPVKIDSQLVLDKSSGINPTQTLTINTGTYYDKSISNLSLTIKSTPDV
jgi:hypothetical protein